MTRTFVVVAAAALGWAVITGSQACATADLNVADGGTCPAEYTACDPPNPMGCPGDPDASVYAIRSLPNGNAPFGCQVRVYDMQRNQFGQCVFVATCTCDMAADGGPPRWDCTP